MIACVLRSGGIYRPEHVQRLASQARTFAPGQAIVCLSDVPVQGVATVPLWSGWPGWWAKLELFAPGRFEAGRRILYLDLDSTILGPLADILERPEPFLALADFYRRPPAFGARGLGSGVMMWTAGQHGDLFEAFAADAVGIMGRYRVGGDQKLIEARKLEACTFWDDAVPGQIVSYKLHCRPYVPDGARLICYHGKPKPWDVLAPEFRPEVTACRQ